MEFLEDLTVEDIAIGCLGFITTVVIIAGFYYAFRNAIDNWFS